MTGVSLFCLCLSCACRVLKYAVRAGLTAQVFPLLSTVVKYRKGDEDTFIDKISKLSMHSIIKKSNRVSSHLKQLTGISPQVYFLPSVEVFGENVADESALV